MSGGDGPYPGPHLRVLSSTNTLRTVSKNEDICRNTHNMLWPVSTLKGTQCLNHIGTYCNRQIVHLRVPSNIDPVGCSRPHPGQHWPEAHNSPSGYIAKHRPRHAQLSFEHTAAQIRHGLLGNGRVDRARREMYRQKKPLVLDDLVAPMSDMECTLPVFVCESSSVRPR